jgi:hypothetical protein
VWRSAFRSLRARSCIALPAILIATALLAGSTDTRAAGLFDFLFGALSPARPTQASAFSNPYDASGAPAGPASLGQRSSGYCVRTCDGKYFPVNTAGRASAIEMCEAFCPASATKLYSGSSIDTAFANDGSRYRDLKNAFVYRERLVDGCTCNGRNSAGLVPVDLALDSTLRKGDIVATHDGLLAYDGNTRNPNGPFTPVHDYAGLGAELRTRLSETKVSPVIANDGPAIVGSIAPSSGTPKIRRARID